MFDPIWEMSSTFPCRMAKGLTSVRTLTRLSRVRYIGTTTTSSPSNIQVRRVRHDWGCYILQWYRVGHFSQNIGQHRWGCRTEMHIVTNTSRERPNEAWDITVIILFALGAIAMMLAPLKLLRVDILEPACCRVCHMNVSSCIPMIFYNLNSTLLEHYGRHRNNLYDPSV